MGLGFISCCFGLNQRPSEIDPLLDDYNTSKKQLKTTLSSLYGSADMAADESVIDLTNTPPTDLIQRIKNNCDRVKTSGEEIKAAKDSLVRSIIVKYGNGILNFLKVSTVTSWSATTGLSVAAQLLSGSIILPLTLGGLFSTVISAATAGLWWIYENEKSKIKDLPDITKDEQAAFKQFDEFFAQWDAALLQNNSITRDNYIKKAIELLGKIDNEVLEKYKIDRDQLLCSLIELALPLDSPIQNNFLSSLDPNNSSVASLYTPVTTPKSKVDSVITKASISPTTTVAIKMPQKSKLEDMSSNDEIEEKTVSKAKKILSIKDIKDQRMINSINQLKEIAPWLSKLHNKDLTIIIKEEDQNIDEHEK